MSGLNRALAASGLVDAFDATRCADETFSKPIRPCCFEIMDELGVEADRVAMIGDTSHDLQMASNARVHGVGVAYGAHLRDELESLGPQAVIESVSGLARMAAVPRRLTASRRDPGGLPRRLRCLVTEN